MLIEDQLWFSERYTKEDKINATWRPSMDRREDGQPEFGGTCVTSKQPAFFRFLLRAPIVMKRCDGF